MQYIAVTVVAISFTIWVVYKLANKLLGLKLRLKPLVLCALFAVILSVILPRFVVGFAGLAGTIGVLAVFAVIFAYFVAYYDETQEPELSGAAAASTMSASIPVVAVANVEEQKVGVEQTAYKQADESALLASQEEAPDSLPSVLTAEESISEVSLAAKVENELSDLPLEAFEVKKESKDVSSQVATEESVKADGSLIVSAEEDVLPSEIIEEETTNAVTLCSIEMPVDVSPVATLTIDESDDQGLLAVSTADKVETAASLSNEVEPTERLYLITEKQNQNEEFILPDSLDGLLDLAFQHKEAKDFSSSLKYFRAALDNFPESEAAPYLVVEVANILKNRGSYDEAIKAFTEGRNLPGLHSDQLLMQEFTDTIAYLRIVRNTLLERRLGFIPYHKIPADVCQDIDMEFREWRNLA